MDDKFHSSEPVKRMPRSVRAGAVGLFALAGTWSADNLKDGYVPEFMVDELGCTTEQAEALVEVKLWRKVRGGYRFREWAPWQPTRAEVEANRKAERDRKAEYRARKAGNTGKDPAVVPPGQTRDSGHPRPVPSRPDPTIDDKIQSSGKSRAPKLARGSDVHNPVESGERFADLDRVAVVVHELTGRHVDRPTAGAIAEHYVARCSTVVRMPTRYVVRSLRAEPLPVLVNFLDSERWSS